MVLIWAQLLVAWLFECCKQGVCEYGGNQSHNRIMVDQADSSGRIGDNKVSMNA